MQLERLSLAFEQYRLGVPDDVLLPVEGADHFSILNALAQPDGALLHALLAHR